MAKQDNQLRINARGLETPGPRMMVESALSGGVTYESLRVVVSSKDAVDDLIGYLKSLGASIETDYIGNDYHIFAEFGAGRTD